MYVGYGNGSWVKARGVDIGQKSRPSQYIEGGDGTLKAGPSYIDVEMKVGLPLWKWMWNDGNPVGELQFPIHP